MPRSVDAPPPTEPAAGLLARRPGWRPAPRAPRTLEVDGVAYTVSVLARRRDRVALSCEPPLGAALPDYARRTRLRSLLETLYPRPIAIFTDAARRAEVWCWATPGARGGLASHERIRWSGREGHDLSPGDPFRLRSGRRGVTEGTVDSPAASIALALLGPVGRALRRNAPSPVTDPLRLILDTLADPGGPAATRALWRGALRLRVLDPACGAGGWLLAAMETLAAIYTACLEQMEVWVGEAALHGASRRPEYLRDLRAALARSGDGPAARDAFVRETILLRNLYGVEGEARWAGRCRSRLHARLGPGAALPSAAIRVRAGDPAMGFATRDAVARALVGTPDAGGALRRIAEEVEAVARADALMRAERLARALDGPGLAAGMRALEGRRAALRRRLDELAGRAAGVSGARARRAWIAEHRPLHAYLEWGGSIRGGFHVVRGAEG